MCCRSPWAGSPTSSGSATRAGANPSTPSRHPPSQYRQADRRMEPDAHRTSRTTPMLRWPDPPWLERSARGDGSPHDHARHPGPGPVRLRSPGRPRNSPRPCWSRSLPTSTYFAELTIEDVLQPGDDRAYEFGLDLLLDGLEQSMHEQTIH